jgi:hypothetical protein
MQTEAEKKMERALLMVGCLTVFMLAMFALIVATLVKVWF